MFLTSSEINYVKEVLDGFYDHDLMLAEFREFMKAEFGVKVHCFFCDNASYSLYKNRLRYMVADADKSIFLDPPWNNRNLAKEEKIKEAFSKLCVKYRKHEKFVSPSEYFAIPFEFETDFRSDVMCLCSSEIDAYLKTIEEVKKTSSFFGNYYIFYKCDKDIKRYDESGLSERIATNIYSIIKANDRYDVFKERRIFFDSVQTLDEKYGGSLFNYHR